MTPYTIRQKIAYLKRKGVIEGFKIRFSNNLLGFRRYMILISLTENNNFQKKQVGKRFDRSQKNCPNNRIYREVGFSL
jgi:DNA-binding Lrp family transcriptional regulator